MNTRQKGKKGEDIAAEFLRQRRYTILERNYRCPLGEIDIIAQENNDIVFVEVKGRSSTTFGPPEAGVHFHKQKKISHIALYYLKTKNLIDHNARFDVVAIMFDQNNYSVELFQNAFDVVS